MTPVRTNPLLIAPCGGDDDIREPPADDTTESNKRELPMIQNTTADPSSSPPNMPSTIQQAAFVRVLRERDEAQKLARQYKKELLHRRKQVRQLQSELEKTKQLMELTVSAPADQGRRRTKKWSKATESSASTAPMQWLRNKNFRNQRNNGQEEQDEMRDALVSSSEPRSNLYMEEFCEMSTTTAAAF